MYLVAGHPIRPHILTNCFVRIKNRMAYNIEIDYEQLPTLHLSWPFSFSSFICIDSLSISTFILIFHFAFFSQNACFVLRLHYTIVAHINIKHPNNPYYPLVFSFESLVFAIRNRTEINCQMKSMKTPPPPEPMSSPQSTSTPSKDFATQPLRTRRLSVLMSPPKETGSRRTSTPASSNSNDTTDAQHCDVCQVAGTPQDLVK